MIAIAMSTLYTGQMMLIFTKVSNVTKYHIMFSLETQCTGSIDIKFGVESPV